MYEYTKDFLQVIDTINDRDMPKSLYGYDRGYMSDLCLNPG